jgi:hypothetical protein
MSSSGLNKIVTTVNALNDNVSISDTTNVVCIDTQNNRIGVKTSDPEYEIDVSGTINTSEFITSKITINQDLSNSFDINYSNNYLRLANSLFINNDLSCSGTLTINNLDVHVNATIGDLSCLHINTNDLSVNNIYSLNQDLSIDVDNVDFSSTNVNINGHLTISGDLTVLIMV